MQGLYIIETPLTKQHQTLKFGMSMTLERRVYDYETYFSNPYYLCCYEFINYIKEEIMYIEALILKETIQYSNNEYFGSEFRKIEFNNLDNIIKNVLKNYNIFYRYHYKPVFDKPKEIFNYELEKVVQNIPMRFINNNSTNNNSNKVSYELLRNYQKECVDIFTTKLKQNEYFQGIYLLATGLGKSWIGIVLCLKHLELYPKDNILWLCFRNDIIDSQKRLFEQYSDKFIVCNHSQQDITKYNKENTSGKIFVVLRQTLINKSFNKGVLNGIIYDECHDASKISTKDNDDSVIDGKTFEILINLSTEHKLRYRIGFSATPLTNNNKQNNGILKLYGYNNDKINYLYKMPLLKGVEQNYLLQPKLKYLMFNLGQYDLNKFYDKINTNSIDDNNNNSKITNEIINTIENIVNNMIYKKGIIWFPSIKTQMYFYNRLFNKLNNSISIYYSNSNNSNNDDIFRLKENNSIMLSCQKFTTGYDAVNMEFGINMVLNESGHIVIQKLGRFTRKNKPLQNYAYLYQVCQYHENNLNDLVNSLTRNYKAIGMKYYDVIQNINNNNNNNKNTKLNLLNLDDINFNEININFNELRRLVVEKLINNKQTNKIRKIIIKENKKRISNCGYLIDTKKKCIEYLQSINIQEIPYTSNWVKYTLGNKEFNEIKNKYYYSIDDFVNACNKLNISNFTTYKLYYTKDNKMPPPEYINDGFYYDLDPTFNLQKLLYNDDNNDY